MNRMVRLERLELQAARDSALVVSKAASALGLKGVYLAMNFQNWAPDNVQQLCALGLTEKEALAYCAEAQRFVPKYE